eukprot:1039170-Rhodomonas_salina.1
MTGSQRADALAQISKTKETNARTLSRTSPTCQRKRAHITTTKQPTHKPLFTRRKPTHTHSHPFALDTHARTCTTCPPSADTLLPLPRVPLPSAP